MAVVTRIKRHARRPTHVVIEIDGDRWRACLDTIVAEHSLSVGSELDAEQMRALTARADQLEAFDRCARTLARGAVSERSLRDRLFRARIPADAAEWALGRCREAGLLDERRFATSYAESRLGRGYGPRAVRAGLRAHGVDADDVQAAVESSFVEGAAFERACALLERRFRNADLDDPAQRRKAIGFLMRRGFDSDDVERAVRQARA